MIFMQQVLSVSQFLSLFGLKRRDPGSSTRRFLHHRHSDYLYLSYEDQS